MDYIANLTGPPVLALATSFRDGPMLDAKGTRSLVEHVVGRLDKLKIEVFSREHPPPHFRVTHNGETANYTIKDCAKLNGGLSKYHHNIVVWHSANKQSLIDSWNATRPTNCPVGIYVE
jgi:hypothetical protein